MINGEDSEAEKRDILMEFIQNMAPDDKAIIFFGKKAKVIYLIHTYICIWEMVCTLMLRW